MASATLLHSLAVVVLSLAMTAAEEPVMSVERVVFQTEYGDIEFGFWPEVGSRDMAMSAICLERF